MWDGTANTLLLAEKNGRQLELALPSPAQGYGSARYTTFDTTFPATWLTPVTDPSSNVNSPYFGMAKPQNAPAVVNCPATWPGPPGLFSQPSSNHAGGAVAAFCDGHTGFLKNSLTGGMYSSLLTPKQMSPLETRHTTDAWPSEPVDPSQVE